jgi:hypothetical protein
MIRRSSASCPCYWIAWCILTALKAATGDTAGAAAAMQHVFRIDPNLSVATLNESFPIRGAENVAHWTQALVKAGLPN